MALSCVRQARRNGHDASLLLLREPTGWLKADANAPYWSLALHPKNDSQVPRIIMKWLTEFPQDFLFLNGCEQADGIPPYLPNTLRCLYVVHDTAKVYWKSAVETQHDLDAIIAVSNAVSDKFKHLLANSTKLRVIHNGAEFSSLPELGQDRADDLLFVGGDNPMKGAHDLMRIWPLLLDHGFWGRLHWFGPISSKFEQRITALPQTERVLRYGRTPRQRIFDVAARSKILLLLSRADSFGMAAIEAMSMGCVPVLWDIPIGAREVVTNSTGLFAPLGDYDFLARQIVRAITQHPRLSPLAIHRARENFSEEEMWRGYASLMHELLESTSPVRSHAGSSPPEFKRVQPRLQLLPAPLRNIMRSIIGRWPRLGYLLRDLRGW